VTKQSTLNIFSWGVASSDLDLKAIMRFWPQSICGLLFQGDLVIVAKFT
jgi:hypothetical protein